MSVTGWHLQVHLSCLGDQKSYPKATRALVEDAHSKERPCPIRIMRRKRFISLSRIRVELIRRIGHRVSAHMAVQKRLVAFAYRSRRPARCPKLIQDHRHCPHVWAHRHRNWNHLPWSHVIFADESRGGGGGTFIYVSGYNIRRPITTSNICRPLHNTKNNNTTTETFIHESSPLIGTLHG